MSKIEQSCPECGALLPKPEKPSRSYAQLKRVHALCQEAYSHWPDQCEFRPKSKEHLRYWLEMQAGHFTVEKTIQLQDLDPDKLEPVLTAVMRTSEDVKQFVEIDGHLLTVKRVGSIAYDALSHADACRLFNELDAVLHLYGMDGAKLLRETEKAA